MEQAANALGNLGQTAARVLAAFEGALEAEGVDLPDARFVSPGTDLAWDGEQLTVNVTTIDGGIPGQPQAGTVYPTTSLLSAQFTISLLRVVPSLSGGGTADDMIPDPAELQQSAEEVANDMLCLARAGIQIHGEYKLTSPGDGFEVGPVSSLGPEGHLVGNRMTITISLS